MKQVTSHRVNEVNEGIEVGATDEQGSGGAHQVYHVSYTDNEGLKWITYLRFQNGPVGSVGVNGITHEVLLAVVVDRLEAFQRGQYACAENAQALMHLHMAVDELNARTQRRRDQGIEGTHQKDPPPPPLAPPSDELAGG